MKKFLFLVTSLFFLFSSCNAQIPRFENNFAQYLKQWNESVFDIWVDKNATLEDNIRYLFYPDSSGRGWLLWDTIRIIWAALLVLMIIYAGLQIILAWNDEKKIWSARETMLYIVYWALLFFSVTWVLGTALQINNPWWGSEALLFNIRNRVIFQILALLKALWFFAAIAFLAYHGYQFMRAYESEDQIESAKEWIRNVLVALLFIKVIDYLYFIASTDSTLFVSRATELIATISRFMAYWLWVLMIASVIYAGVQLVTSNGDESKIENAKNTVLTVFLTSLIIFLFLLIIYQVFNQFT